MYVYVYVNISDEIYVHRIYKGTWVSLKNKCVFIKVLKISSDASFYYSQVEKPKKSSNYFASKTLTVEWNLLSMFNTKIED